MTLTDLAIIYLACGAPLSMHYFFGQHGRLSLGFAARVVLVSLAWPVAITFFIRRRLVDGRNTAANAAPAAIDRRLDELRVQMENRAQTLGAPGSFFESREIFARYTGLAFALTRHSLDNPANELFEMSGHRDVSLAARCSSRKQKNRLQAHWDASRSDYFTMIGSLVGRDDLTILSPAIEVAEIINDRETARKLLRIADQARRPADQNKLPEIKLTASRFQSAQN